MGKPNRDSAERTLRERGKSFVTGAFWYRRSVSQQRGFRKVSEQLLSFSILKPSVKVTDIGVLVKDGTVTLNGYATSYGEKGEAVRAVKRVTGVKAIADDIEVKLPSSLQRNDGDIATAAAHQIDTSTSIPEGIVQATSATAGLP